jgi:hypothetical protein
MNTNKQLDRAIKGSGCCKMASKVKTWLLVSLARTEDAEPYKYRHILTTTVGLIAG